ncbi:procathepsin L-like [Harmonia axyridis]|uniref:procathepsin L-like n=1 Tax=Harmonia axyridis TaxID=115357 RepID=UPI001E277F1C|nr:procathepsin L-like [Harmonia axyridis]
MKTVLLLFVVFSCEALEDIGVHKEWLRFQELFGKKYTSTKARDQRFTTFKNNLKTIAHHNSLYRAGNTTYRMGVNQFTDWSPEEHSLYVNKFKVMNNSNVKVVSYHAVNETIPESIDWRLRGAVTEVKNQGHCGSCWAFSAVGALEGQASIRLGRRVRLSEQNLLDCADADYGNHGCNGGDSYSGFIYVQNYGIQSGQTYPYVAAQGKCRQKTAELYVEDYFFLPNSEEQLKTAVATLGPIAVAIESTQVLQHYAGGIFFDRTCTGRLNHGVLAVGYGVEAGQEYWLIKNSWGSAWGEQGYFRLARNRYNNCGIADYASRATVRPGN